MALLNPGFETRGDSPGMAKHWSLQTLTAAERIAGFNPIPTRAWEDFERWIGYQEQLEEVTVVLAFFDHLAEGVEDFEEGWNNDLYLFALPAGQIVIGNFDGGHAEEFEGGWLASPFAATWDEVIAETGLFDSRGYEGFEDHWRENQNYHWNLADVVSVSALFDGEEQDDFEDNWTALAAS